MRWTSGAVLGALALALLAICPVRAAEWQTYLSEDFSAAQTMFYTGQAGEAQYTIDEMGRYVIDGLNTGSDSLSSLTDNLYYYYLESQCELVRTIAGEQAFTGVVFHYNKSIPGKLSYYVFYYYGDGYYGAKRVIGDQVDILIPLTPTDQLDMYGVNVLAVDAQGTSFDLYINGRFVDGFTDVRIDGGGFGFYVSKYARAAFDNFTVKIERRAGGREDLSEPAVTSNVADEGGSAEAEFRDYRFPEIPKDPSRPTYSWEVGVDKTRKAKPGAEQPVEQTEAASEPDAQALPAASPVESATVESEGDAEDAADAPALRPVALPAGEELIDLNQSAAGRDASSAADRGAGNGNEAQEVTTVPAEPVRRIDPQQPRQLPKITVPEIEAPQVDLPADTSGDAEAGAAEQGELVIPDPVQNTPPPPAEREAAQAARTALREVRNQPAEDDAGADDGELPLYPTEPAVREPQVMAEPAGEEAPPQAEDETSAELPLYAGADDTAPATAAREAAAAVPTEPAAPATETVAQPGSEEQPADTADEDALPVGESDDEGSLRFASVEPKLEEMGVGRATTEEATPLSELDWQAVPIETVPDEAESPAPEDGAKAESIGPAAASTEPATDSLPPTPPETQSAAEPETTPPPSGAEYYAGDALKVIADDFSAQHWPVSAEGAAAYRYFGGAYEIDNLQAKTMAISFQDSALSDSEFSIDVEFLEGAGHVGYGVASRLSVVNGVVSYYGLFICQNGEFMLLKVHDGSERVLSDWQASSLIRPTKPNRITLDVRDGQLYAYINGELAATVADADLSGGGYALLAGPGVSVRFDNLRIHGFE